MMLRAVVLVCHSIATDGVKRGLERLSVGVALSEGRE